MSRRFVCKFQTLSVVAVFVATVIILAIPGLDAQVSPPRLTIKSGASPQDAGNPLLLPAVLYGSGGYGAASVAVADLNGDGRPDLVVVNLCASQTDCSHGTVGVLLGNGDGTFKPALVFDAGEYRPFSLAVLDVNGDGKPDVILIDEYANSQFAGGTVAVLLGNGDGTLKPAAIYSTGGYGATGVAVADLNGDGKPDIVVTSCYSYDGYGCPQYAGFVSVLKGNGDGTFQPAQTFDMASLYISQMTGANGVAIADMNGDGIPDLIIATDFIRSGAVLAVLSGNGDGTFYPQTLYGVGSSDGLPAIAPAVADLYGGSLDLLALSGQYEDPPIVSVVVPPYSTQSLLLNGQPGNSVTAADLDGDGTQDLIVGTGAGPGVLLGKGSTFSPIVFYYSGLNGSSISAATDLNNDGKIDLVATSADANGNGAVGVLINNRQGPPYISTTTAVVSSVNPSDRKQTVTYTATVTNQSGGAVTGTVTFADAPVILGKEYLAAHTTVPLTGNQASWSAYYTQDWTHVITVAYSGDAANSNSVSPQLRQFVGKGPFASETRVTTSGSPCFYGKAVTFSTYITWAGGTVPDGGLVTFSDGTNQIGTSTTVAGVATFTTSSLAAGTHAIVAAYRGANKINGSHGKVTQVVGVPPVATKTVLTTSGSPSVSGQQVTFTATISSDYGTIPDGEVVTFYDGAMTIGTGATASGVAAYATSSLSVKTHTIKATYAGDATFKPSTGKVTQVVNQSEAVEQVGPSPSPAQHGVAPAAQSPKAGNPLMSTNCGSSVKISSSGSPSLITDPVTFTGDVDMSTHCKGQYSPICNGAVTFYDGKTQIGSILVDDKCEANSVQHLSAGKHRITGVYQPDLRGWRHSYAYLIQIVDKYPTIITLASSPNPSTFGEDVTLTVTVTTDEEDTPTGRVKFRNGTTTIGFATLDGNGVATLRKGKLPVGSNLITAEYLSDSTYASSTSAVLNQVVNP